MKIKILATGMAPDYYTVSGEVITAHLNGKTEEYDLSDFPDDGVFQGADPVDGVPAIRKVTRENGELSVTLCQQVGPGQWRESEWLDSAEYNPDVVYAVFNPNARTAGNPWVKTRQGKEYFSFAKGA